MRVNISYSGSIVANNLGLVCVCETTKQANCPVPLYPTTAANKPITAALRHCHADVVSVPV